MFFFVCLFVFLFAIEVERVVSLREVPVDCDRFQENQRWEVPKHKYFNNYCT